MLSCFNVLLVYVPHVAEAHKRKPYVHKGDKSKPSVTHIQGSTFPWPKTYLLCPFAG